MEPFAITRTYTLRRKRQLCVRGQSEYLLRREPSFTFLMDTILCLMNPAEKLRKKSRCTWEHETESILRRV